MNPPALRRRLRAALSIAALAFCLLALLPDVAMRLTCLFVGLLALGYIWGGCPSSIEERAEFEQEPSPGSASQDILASAGHDLRQPVQAISLFAASLAAYPMPDSSRKMVAGIETGVQSLSGMLESICGIAKLQAGRLGCRLQVLALEDFLVRAVDDKLDIAHERQLHLRHVRTGRSLCADSALLQQALGGMLAYAFDQSRGDGGILVGSRKRGEQVWVEIRNTGTAVSQPQALHIQQFVPSDAYFNSLPDKGYGLAYVQGLAQLMGGQLELFVWPESGSLLRLRLQAA